ncbi:flavonoid 3'-hydroxylase cytochrome P450 [Artemisia annua]|uniref:Flavonoid 3'-hydroxylase cytochrome P450 n=1 Tax=Artemisia annua TaxID=35608 RepID=A0A2U1PLP2_ARTAN|nr:flavonoid 3'-hydroxylase cytochrome P450 [Artemisia annua]
MIPDFKEKIYYTMIKYWSWWWEVDNESDNVARTILTILVPILVLLWYKWTISYTKNPRPRLPPGPYGLPVIGYLPFLSSNLHERFTEMSHKYGPIFSLYLGSKLHVVVNSIDLAKVVARDLDQTFANRNPPVTAITATYDVLDIAWSNNNTHWRNMRKLLVSQVLSNANLDACQGFRTDEVRKTFSHVYAKMGEKVDINGIAFETELNVVTKMLWGRTESGIQREMQKQHEHLDRIFDNVIKARMEGVLHDDGKKDFLQIMLELKDQKDGPTSLNMVQIKALLFNILTASTDTTSTMVEWVMAEILHYPEVMRRVQEELTTVIGMNNIVEESHLPKTDEVRKTFSHVYAKMGEKVDINGIAFETELNVVTKMLWGRTESGDLFEGFREVVFKMMELLGAPNISDFIPMLSWFDLQGIQREMQKQHEHLDRIFDNVIKARMEGVLHDDGKKDFLQIMLELKDQKDGPTSLNMVQIKALLFNILTASTDTTSTMVEWVMAEILHYPEVMRRVQEELTTVIGMNNIVEESHLPKLVYLDAVVKETFRVHPPLPLLIQRCPNESCTVGGYTIPKGSIVYINVMAIHHDPKNWTNPLEFKPERFLNGKWDYNGYTLKYLPFGSGRRICPGIPLGEKMLMYILASLLHSFEWRLPKEEELELSDEFGFVTKKRGPLIAIPSQRLPEASLYS